ncbi:MAG: DUF2520 domain-containing protein [Xanthomonadales bacterium]|nr:DUF2520 domain-containing protein [Xanthomonadales bacterium]
MNRQVPENSQPIAIVGNGRVARHIIHYFELVGQPYTHWFRGSAKHPNPTNSSRLARFKHKFQSAFVRRKTLSEVIQTAELVLLLISDDAIESFIDQNVCLRHKKLVHFSGSLTTIKAVGCHPLMTFGSEFYDLQQYQNIPFVVDQGVDFKQLFPKLCNAWYEIEPANKVRYHAMCVMAGNFSQMLWQATAKALQNMNLPAELMHSYLQQNTENYLNDPENALTGPFVRGDVNTIEQHLQNLQSHPLGELYRAFYNLYQQPNSAAQRSQL